MAEIREIRRRKFRSCARILAFAFVAFVFSLAGHVPNAAAQQKGQLTFHSAEEAGTALFTAAQNENERALLDILGPAGKDVISSGDPTEDMNHRTSFVIKYQQMHRIAKQSDGSSVLYVGAENWPFPIPLVNKNGVWFFDTDAGKQEILMRRIGENELAAIDACRQLVDAEKQYEEKIQQRGLPSHYAQRFVSDKGDHNGLFWSATGDEPDSPLDPLIASAGQEKINSNDSAADPLPFNGYYFGVLTGQGRNASGGTKSYIVDGQMVGGFAFVAYPAEYRSSGVMTFIVSQSGVVYEKDLGPDTTKLAAAMTQFNPDSTWHQVD